MTSKCRAVANYIIDELNKYNTRKQFTERVLLSTKRLQKLLYLCDIEYMKRNYGHPMFEDNFYAWPSGPVIPNVYCFYVQFSNGEMRPSYIGDMITLSKETKTVIDLVLESTNDLYTIDLVNMSSVVGGPWAKVFDPNDHKHEQIISKDDIYNYYLNKSLINKYNELTSDTKVLKLTKN